MLRQLSVHNVVLVDRLDLEFEPGLGVLTGETGAGKSILLDALGLALGARADTALVRTGADSASVTAEIDLPSSHPAHGQLADQGIEVEPGEPTIIRRTVRSDGGSRAFVAGCAVPAGTLREFGSLAVEVHGQHDDRGLLNPRGHRALLDAFGAIDLDLVSRRWADVARIESALAEATEAASLAERDREWLDHSVKEIDALAPEPGEETRLAEQRAAMQLGAKAGETLTGLDELLAGSDGAIAQLRQAARRIERGAADHPLLAEALASLDRALIEASEAEDRIARAATCGEWVTTNTWLRSASRASRSPIALATAPPTPLSISSKIIVPALADSASATFRARMNRDNSPPDAIRLSGPNGAPGLVEISNSTRSLPVGPGSAAAITVRKRAASSFNGANSRVTAASSLAADLRRRSPTLAAASS